MPQPESSTLRSALSQDELFAGHPVADFAANKGAQYEFLRTRIRYPALIGGQGSGKTWGGSARLVYEHVRHPGSDSLGVEPTFALLRQVMVPAICDRLDECHIEYRLNLSPLLEIVTPELNSKFIMHSGGAAETLTAFEVGRAWIDEPARIPEHQDPKRNIWIACIGRVRCPTVPASERRIFITGTHEGKGTWVYNKWEKDAKPGYRVFRAHTADNPSSREQAALYQAEYGPELSEQYVRGYAVDDSMAAIPYDIIERCQDERAHEADLEELRHVGGPLFVGMDIGRSKSLTVFWVVRAIGDGTLITEAVLTFRKMDFQKQFEVIETICRMPGFSRMAIDATYNPQTAEDAVSAFGATTIEAVVFTPQSKREIYQAWIKACQTGRLRIPRSEDIAMDFFSVKRVVSSLGVVTYQAPFTVDGHADRASAAGLAVWASRRGEADISFTAGPDMQSRSMGLL